MFSDYLKRQFSHRDKPYAKLGISKSTYYEHLKHPEMITLGELRTMMVVGELDEEKVMDWICRREKK